MFKPQKMAGSILLMGCILFTGCSTKMSEPVEGSAITIMEQEYQLSQTYDGYTVELKSTISDSSSVYVTFGLSAPDDMDLSSVLDPISEERLSFQGLFATTGTDFPANISCDVAEDGDGKKNTLNAVLRIDPVASQGETAPFGPGTICTIEFKGIVKWGYDREYEQELLSTKYAGQTDYILDPEESKLVHPQTLLVAGDWKFQIGLTLADMDTIELLSAPVSTNVFVIRIGASEYETVESVDKVTLTSVRLSPLGATISFEKPEPIEKFDCIYVNMDQFGDYSRAHGCEGKNIVLVMKDGTEILFDQTDGAKNEAYLYADSPIALKEADYLLLSDGTKLDIFNLQ